MSTTVKRPHKLEAVHDEGGVTCEDGILSRQLTNPHQGLRGQGFKRMTGLRGEEPFLYQCSMHRLGDGAHSWLETWTKHHTKLLGCARDTNTQMAEGTTKWAG